MAAYKTHPTATPNTTDFALYIENANGEVISPFHDIPLFVNEEEGIVNMVVEIPRWSNAKFEISKEKAFNPIKQDVKKGALRFVANVFPHKGYIWNYGALPQTWEDPSHKDADTNANGDNDPLDVCEIGSVVSPSGTVKQVKVLGVMALLDEGETDWKVLAIDVKDPLAAQLNDIEDVEKKLPGFLKATEEWFRIYKIPDGKPENKFAFNGEAKNKAYAIKVIKETHHAWQKLILGQTKSEKIEVKNITVANSPYKIAAAADIPAAEHKTGTPLDAAVDKWHFVSTL